jgi:hypothetical protein
MAAEEQGQPRKRNRGGRPAWTPPDLNIVKGLASVFLNQEQIAQTLGIHPATLYRKKKQLSEFCDAIKRGRAEGIAVIASKMFEGAMAGNTTAQIFLLKVHAGWRDGSGGAQVDVNINGVRPGEVSEAEASERKRAERRAALIRLLSPNERRTYLELLRRAAERQEAQRRGKQEPEPPLIEARAQPAPETQEGVIRPEVIPVPGRPFVAAK